MVATVGAVVDGVLVDLVVVCDFVVLEEVDVDVVGTVVSSGVDFSVVVVVVVFGLVGALCGGLVAVLAVEPQAARRRANDSTTAEAATPAPRRFVICIEPAQSPKPFRRSDAEGYLPRTPTGVAAGFSEGGSGRREQ